MENCNPTKRKDLFQSFLRITLCLLFLTGGPASQLLLGQSLAEAKQSTEKEKTLISVDFNNTPLDAALMEIGQKYGISINYNASLFDSDRTTSYQIEREQMADVLKSILPDNVICKFFQGNIILQEKTKEPQEIIVSGQVIDGSSKKGLPGVNVMVKGTTIGTSTDAGGNYSLTAPSEQDTLVFSFIGYATEQKPIEGKNTVDVVLQSETISGDELVVVGYGTVEQENLTGSISTVKGNDLADIPASRVDQVLQGRAPGVHVIQNNGAPGAASTIRIRGGNSIQGNNDPLFVIDGFVVGTNYNLNNLNANDIESIEILKDATATSVYGTRGANGVILVTTKSGKGIEPGRPQVSLNTYSGLQYLMNTIDLMSGSQHAAYANEDAEFRSAAKPFEDPNTVPDVNWIDQITRDAPIHNLDLSVAGQSHNQSINYYVSGNYFNQQGIVRGSGIKKYNFRTNLDINFSKNVKAGVKLNTSRLINENNKVNFGLTFRELLPNRAIYNEDNFTATNPVSATVQSNPVADLELQVDHSYVTNVLGNLYVEIEPLNNLVLKSSFGPEINNYKRNRYNPGILPEYQIVGRGGDGQVNTHSSINLLNENTISYSTTLGQSHQLDLLSGFTWQTFQREGNNARGFGFSNDALEYDNLSNGSDPTRNVIGSNWNSYQLVSWLGRTKYGFQDKYLLTLVGRVDGSSRFAGSNNEYGFFPSGAVAWRLSEEPFIQKLNFFDDLKFRASYGVSGSQAIGSFRTLAVMNGISITYNGIEQSGVINGRPANEELKWETTKQLDIGLDAAFFNDRLSIEADFYNKKTEDLLLNTQIPRQTGFANKLQNIGAIRNKGLEFKISSVNVSQKDFQWTSMLTLSGNRNEVLDLGGVDFIDIAAPTRQGGPAGRLIVGESAPVFIGVEYLGTWKSQEAIDASGQTGQEIGGPRFKDTNGDEQITVEDFEVLGSPQPDFVGGIQNTFTYKNWQLDVFIQGTYGNEVFNSLTQTAFFGRGEANKYTEVLDRWTPENTDSDVPRAGAIAGLAEIVNNTKEVEDGSHLRLKNLKLTYNLPVKKWGIKGLEKMSLYFSGSNLLLLSNFSLFDPEVSQYGSDNTRLGFAQGEYPYGRTLSVGIRAIF